MMGAESGRGGDPSTLATVLAALAAAVHLLVACPTVSAIAYGPTYPDSCPMGVDTDGVPSRLCLPNASGGKGWSPTYNMSMSTIIMPCNTSGYFDPGAAARYGLVDIDWSNAKQEWANAKPMDCEERLVTQARLIKSQNPATKVWVYRNLVKATPWYTSVREKICDPDYAGWFLRFNTTTPHVAKCDNAFSPPKCSEFYHDPEKSLNGLCPDKKCDCGCVPCGYYVWDHRNASLRAWLVDYAAGATSVGDPHIDGIFLDDDWSAPGGPTESGRDSLADMGLSASDVINISAGWVLSMKDVQQAVLDKGGFDWRLFSPGHGTTGSDPIGGAAVRQLRHHFLTISHDFSALCHPTRAVCSTKCPCSMDADWCVQSDGMSHSRLQGCAAALRERCVHNDTLQRSALMMDAGKTSADFVPNLAAFLLIRGPYAWFGNAWQGCNNIPARRPELDRDYGTPKGACTETHPGTGVFTRSWTRADITVDCNAWVGKIDPVNN